MPDRDTLEKGRKGDADWDVAQLKALAEPIPVATERGIAEEDIDFIQDCRALLRRQKMGWRGSMSFVAIITVAVLIWWASWAELVEVTRGIGKVIPSKSLQLIQSLEGGILEEILVEEGQAVTEGQPLIRIQDAIFAAHYHENIDRRDLLAARIARLSAESAGFQPLVFGGEIPEKLADIERDLFDKRKADFETTRRSLEERLALASEAEKLMAAARENRSVSPIELIQVQKEVATLKGDLATLRTKLEREAMEQYDRDYEELAALEHSIERDKDRLDRTVIKSPVRGTVNKIHINTVGRVIASGVDIMEIVPLDDTLLVEANIRPADIAFIGPGLAAMVKFTAYDFAVYGGIPGKVEHLSADTITNEKGESFYQVKVRTERNTLGLDKNGEDLPIMPGMVTEVDIMTGKKTVLHYILRPLNRARERAMRER